MSTKIRKVRQKSKKYIVYGQDFDRNRIEMLWPDLISQELGILGKDIEVIPNDTQKYMSFMVGDNLVFIDSIQFMAISLNRLASDLLEDGYRYTSGGIVWQEAWIDEKEGCVPASIRWGKTTEKINVLKALWIGVRSPEKPKVPWSLLEDRYVAVGEWLRTPQENMHWALRSGPMSLLQQPWVGLACDIQYDWGGVGLISNIDM